jgi:hypothetical protein
MFCCIFDVEIYSTLTYTATNKPLKITTMKTTNQIQVIIEKEIGKKVELEKASDCVNLMYTAKINGIVVANVYKSFDAKFNPMELIRFSNLAY